MIQPISRVRMDEDFLDRIDQAFHEGQIDGETMVLACLTLEFTLVTSTVDSAPHSSLSYS